MSKHVVIIPGDDAAPEAMAPTVEILKSLDLDIAWTEFPSGEEGVKRYGSRSAFEQALRAAIDQSDTTLFGSTNGTTGGIGYLRWGKRTYANVRPARWRPGFRSPLKNPDGINFVIVRENLEDLYMGIEGDLEKLSSLSVTSWLILFAQQCGSVSKTSAKREEKRTEERGGGIIPELYSGLW